MIHAKLSSTDLEKYTAFLRKIEGMPDNDAPRLALADQIEEWGFAARAELIRVQCRFAELSREQVARYDDDVDWAACTGISAGWCPNCGDCKCPDPEDSRSDPRCPLHARDSNHCCLEALESEMVEVMSRKLDLCEDNWAEWVGPLAAMPSTSVAFRRGFIDSVLGPFAPLIGAKCVRCNGRRDWHDALTGDGRCFDCGHIDRRARRDSVRPLAELGPELLLVTRVDVTDDAILRPPEFGSLDRYIVRSAYRSRLGNPPSLRNAPFYTGKTFASREEASTALSREILLYALRSAGLEPPAPLSDHPPPASEVSA